MKPLIDDLTSTGLKKAFESMTIEVRYNKVLHTIQWTSERVPEWRRSDDVWRDSVADYIEQNFEIPHGDKASKPAHFSKLRFNRSLNALASHHRYDPGKVFFDNLPEWDGKHRLEGLLHDHFGAEDEPINRWASAAIWVGVLERMIKPGQNFRIMPVLIGPENCGKSTFVESMLPPELMVDHYQTQLPLSDKRKDLVEQLLGVYLCEVSELTGATKADRNAIKAFLTAGKDYVRLAYRHDSEHIDRTAFLVGTANPSDSSILPLDSGGNTRFLCVNLSRGFDVEATIPKIRMQCWAEAKMMISAGFTARRLPRDMTTAQRISNAEFEHRDDDMINMISEIPYYSGLRSALDLAKGCGLVARDEKIFPKSLKFSFYSSIRHLGFIPAKSGGTRGWRHYTVNEETRIRNEDLIRKTLGMDIEEETSNETE